MIDWNKVKSESIEAINEIIDNRANSKSKILGGEYNKKLSSVTEENWKSMCAFYLQNYKLSCKNLNVVPEEELVLKAENFIQ